MKFAALVGILLIIFLSGCISQFLQSGQNQSNQTVDVKANATSACIAACQSEIASGKSLELGPCLTAAQMPADWVCDVVHSPRLATDNLEQNQCSAYTSGAAHHFVEVTPACGLIRAV